MAGLMKMEDETNGNENIQERVVVNNCIKN